MFLQLSHFFLPFIPLYPAAPSLQHSPLLSSCPWDINLSTSASPFLILFLTSSFLFFAYQLCLLFPVSFPPFLPHFPNDNPPCDLHFCDSAPFLVVYIVHFFFKAQLLIVVFVVILLVIVLFFFFLDKSV